MQPLQSLPPRTIIGNYKILKELGQGGFGITYVAWDAQLERNVVLKECFPAAICVRNEQGRLQPRSQDMEDAYAMAMEDMRKEARTLAKLNHARVVRIYDVFEANGSLFYVMPWLEGGSLRERMDEAVAPVDPGLAQQWLCDVLEGLQYLHEKGFIHRDLKPGNILFDEDERPVIIDFGAAVQAFAHTITQGEFSFAYAAPEQISGKGTPFAGTDLFALAATWYELLSGSLPEETLRRMQKDDLQPLSDLPGMAELPSELLRFVMCNLQLEPEARSLSAAEWLQCLRGERVLPVLHRRRSRRTRLMWCLGVVAAIVGVALGVAPLFDSYPAQEELDGASQIDHAMDALYRAYMHLHRPRFEQARLEYEKMTHQLTDLRAAYERDCEKLLAEVEAKVCVMTPEERATYFFAGGESYDRLYDLTHACMNEQQKLIDAYFRNHGAAVIELISNPLENYSVASEHELALMPLLEQRLEKEFAQYRLIHGKDYLPDDTPYRARLRALDAS